MPYVSTYVLPDEYLTHNEVTVYHMYNDDDYGNGPQEYHFTTSSDGEFFDDESQIDVRELTTWAEPEQPHYVNTESIGTPEYAARHAAWHVYNKALQTAIREAIIKAIEIGEIVNYEDGE
jgi:hypothetical protein